MIVSISVFGWPLLWPKIFQTYGRHSFISYSVMYDSTGKLSFHSLDLVTDVFKRTAREKIMNSGFRAIGLKIIICKLIEAR
jgi:hypothetical protein